LTAIYDMRLANLNEKELNLAKVISVFEGNPDQMVLKGLLNLNQEELNDILSMLQINNIIQSISGANTVPVISSDGLKKHIYSLIENKKEFHSQLAETISGSGIEINRSEFARQYELASDFEAAYFIWKEELRNAEGIAAFSYMKSILNHLLELKISESEKNEVRYQLIEILYHLSDFITVLNNIEKVDVEGLTSEKALELYIIQGSSLINSGKLEEGMKLINSLIPKVKDEFRRSKLFVELAYAKFDANNFSEAAKLGEEILSRKDVSDEDRGRVHNLLGLCAIYIDQNSDESRDEFFKALEYYKQADLKDKVAAIEVNIGNVYNLQGDSKNAELHWKNALNLNLSIGSLEQEAVLLLNNGIYYADKANF
jgi:tetratricopeptide (TPR) repeat protein